MKMSSLTTNAKLSLNKDQSKDSDKIDLSTKDYQVSSSEDHRKYQQDNQENLPESQSQASNEYLPQIVRKAICIEKTSSMNEKTQMKEDSMDYSTPIIYNIINKKFRNKIHLKPISGDEHNYNSTLNEISPIQPNTYKESIGSMLQPDAIEKEGYQPKLFKYNKVVDSTNADSVIERADVIRIRNEPSLCSILDFNLLSLNSYTTEVVNDRIRPANKKAHKDKNKDIDKYKEKDKGNTDYNVKLKITPQEDRLQNKLDVHFVQAGEQHHHPHLEKSKQTQSVVIKPNKLNLLKYQFHNFERFQFFGSNVTRQLLFDTKQKDETPGPGTYFKSQFHKSKPIVRITKHSPDKEPVVQVKASTINYASEDNTLGPGSYDVKSSFLKRCCSNVDKFGSCERRFIQSVDSTIPGPGSYNCYENAPIKKDKSFSSREPSLLQKNLEEITKIIIHHNKLGNAFPEIGQYNPERFNSIEYKIKSKQAKQKSIAPFSSLKRRFNPINKDLAQADFCTFPSDFDKIQKSHNYKNTPFLFSLSRDQEFISSLKKQPHNWPGELNKESYFDWNKKSFNMKYA